MLSGPCDEHAPFWTRLAEDVKLEEPEELHRYLGRVHRVEKRDIPTNNLFEFFKSVTKENKPDQESE